MAELYWTWAVIAGLAALTVFLAFFERTTSSGRPDGRVHYGHCDVDDHEYEDLNRRHDDGEFR